MSEQQVFVGTSGWTYDDWSGRFYPEKGFKGPERLTFYASVFNTVEVNATFYRTPTEQMIESWNKRLDDYFHLVVKGTRAVTHIKRLADCREQLQTFLERILQLKRLKVVLWQLPPSLRKDAVLLNEFLHLLPEKVHHAVEFRHTSWWADDVLQILAKHNAALVGVSHPKLPEIIIPTTDFFYVRFHGQGKNPYMYLYSQEELSHWVSLLEPLLKGKPLYAFFNNDYHAHATKNALMFRDMLVK